MVTANTVIEFDFSSTSQGEIHAIGFENNNTLTSSRYFKVHGTQNYGVTNFDNYSSGTTTYVIPVGNFYTGAMDRLVFINDNDGGSGNNSLFSNVKIYEGSCNGSLSAKEVIAQLDNKEALLGTDDEGMNTIIMTPNPTSDQFSLHVNSKSTSEILISIYNTIGQKKYEARLHPGVNNFSANNMELSSGIYVVKIQSEGGKDVVKKLIVK
ncbi:T9SS type A sorting domain-containing protein [Aquimarina algiphila]|uniref:T9SS type A sorting domain-containing protein n=2 Tax=Aquimarina TaxID=290174 RepID=UPI00232B5D79|nr:T9SS type A sorting domain-containing protein [Aquimarina algiphila]